LEGECKGNNERLAWESADEEKKTKAQTHRSRTGNKLVTKSARDAFIGDNNNRCLKTAVLYQAHRKLRRGFAAKAASLAALVLGFLVLRVCI